MSTRHVQRSGSARAAEVGQWAGEESLGEGDAPQSTPERGAGRAFRRYVAGWARAEPLPIALICLLIVAAAVGSALAFSAQGTPIHGARADILYVSDPATPLDVRERTLATQRELIRSRAVMAPVAARSRMTLHDLQEATSVEAGVRSDVLRITVGDRDPARARQLARAVTSEYFALSRRLAAGAQRERQALEDEMRRLTVRATRASDAEATIIGHRVARLQDRALELDAAGASRAMPTLLADAYPLDDPLSPKPIRAVAGGLIIGWALATGVAIMLARRARRWPDR